MKVWKHIGIFIILLSLFHVGFSFAFNWQHWFDSSKSAANLNEASLTIVCDFFLLVLGSLCVWIQKKFDVVMPLGFSIALILMGMFGVFLYSSLIFWLLMLFGIIGVVVNHQSKKESENATAV